MQTTQLQIETRNPQVRGRSHRTGSDNTVDRNLQLTNSRHYPRKGFQHCAAAQRVSATYPDTTNDLDGLLLRKQDVVPGLFILSTFTLVEQPSELRRENESKAGTTLPP